MTTYSFGLESPLKFEISDKMAENYNSAVAEFLKAQQRFNQRFGRRWDPDTDPIVLRWTKAQKKAYNDFADVLKKTVENDGRYYPNDIMDDFLVKNVAPGAAAALGQFGRVLGWAAASGVVHGLLRRS